MRVCLVFPERGRKSSRARPRDSATPRCSRTEGLSSRGSQDRRHEHCREGFPRVASRGFDDQLSANAEKVDNVRTDRNLPAKLESAEAAITKKAPEAQFAVGRHAAHRSGAGALVRRDASVSLHRSSIGGQTLIRRAFGAPPSPRGRRGSRAAVRSNLLPAREGSGDAGVPFPSPSGGRWPAKPAG
jgi:hypothetical protein